MGFTRRKKPAKKKIRRPWGKKKKVREKLPEKTIVTVVDHDFTIDGIIGHVTGYLALVKRDDIDSVLVWRMDAEARLHSVPAKHIVVHDDQPRLFKLSAERAHRVGDLLRK